MWARAAELRALLDKPVENNGLSLGGRLAMAATGLINVLDDETLAWTETEELKRALEDWSMGKPAAQHQGEPVAWVFADSVGGIRWRPQALGSLLDGTALYAQPSEPLPPHSLLQEVLKGWEESCYGDPPVRMAQAIKAVREHLAQAERLAPLAVEAAKAFAKGFNTLESGGGKYRINMQFQSREDAWGAFTALAHLKQLNTPQ